VLQITFFSFREKTIVLIWFTTVYTTYVHLTETFIQLLHIQRLNHVQTHDKDELQCIIQGFVITCEAILKCISVNHVCGTLHVMLFLIR